MPMHDWTRVGPNLFHDFYVGWLASLQHSLNNGTLPSVYYSLVEQVAPPFEPDVFTPQVPAVAGGHEEGAVATAVAGPQVQIVDAAAKVRRPHTRARRLAIRHSSTHHLVAVIEIVSPGNKASKREFVRFVDKAVFLLQKNIHLLLVDPFPPTPRDPHGLHAAVWRAVARKTFRPPPGKPLTLAAYAAGPDDRCTAYVEPAAVGDTLRRMPLFLTPDTYVNVPLEETYTEAWVGFPKPWRGVLEAP